MLVLTRVPLESIVINDNIVVTVCSIDRNKVRLGITAPRDITILRTELLDIKPPELPQEQPATAAQP